jgi:S1-C subfamily serine protease
MAVEWSGLSGGKDNSVLSIGSVTSSSTFSSSKGTVQLLDTLNLRALDVNKAPVGTVLVNGSAQLLGIVTGRKGNQVVEIPASLAEQVGQQLVEHGRLTHGWLGIEGQGTVAPPLQTTNVRSGTSTKPTPGPAAGVKVLSVGSRSSAAQAGLRAGDVIEAIDGQAVASMQALQRALYVLPPRTYVSLTVERGTSVNTFYTLLQPAA